MAIRVKDFQRCIDFYQKYFGFEEFDSSDNPPPVGKEMHLRSGDAHIELFLAKDTAKEPDIDSVGKKDRGECHHCFNVDHVEDVYERMKKDGVPMTLDLVEFRYDSGKRAKGFLFKDPDDTVVEVLEGYY